MGTNTQFLDEISKAIIMLLIKHPEGLSFSDIVRLTGKPRETVNRRLKALVESSIVEKIERGRGKRTIYRLEKRRLEELLVADYLPKVFFLDILRGFIDLFLIERDDNAYAFLCKFAISYPSFLLGSLSSVFETLIDIGHKLSEKQKISEKELRDRLYGVGIFISGSGFDLDKFTVLAAATATARLVKEGKIKKIDDKKLLEICSDSNKNEQLYSEGLILLVGTGREYAKRLLDIEKIMSELDPWEALKEVYWEVAKDYVDNYLKKYLNL